MEIIIGDDGWIVGVKRVPTPHTFGPMNPELAVVHETGTRITPGACVKYCTAPRRTNPVRVGYHVAIERNGEIVQMAPFNKKVRHAGVSSWFGKKYCNAFSIGVGIVGPTELKGTAQRAKAFFGKYKRDRYGKRRFFAKVFTAEDGLAQVDSPYHGRGHVWLKYTRDQMDALDDFAFALKMHYPDIELRGHYEVSPGRKIDPNPMLDIQALGADDPVLQSDDVVAAPEPKKLALPAPEAAVAAPVDVSKPPPVVPEVAKPESTDATLKKQSREYSATDILEKSAKAAAGVAVVKKSVDAVVPDEVKPDTFDLLKFMTELKSYMDVGSSMISAYGWELLIAGALGVAGVTWLVKYWKRQSYDNGLYEPSGADAE